MNCLSRVPQAVAAAIVALACASASADTRPPAGLAGLWCAKRRFDGDVRGPLTLVRSAEGWRAEIAGRQARVRQEGVGLAFELPNDEGAFRGSLAGSTILGHWIQPATIASGQRYATPVVLSRQAADRWRGDVTPLDDTMTLYLPVEAEKNGQLGAFLRNPERNAGRFLDVRHLRSEGRSVTLTGRPSQEGAETTVAQGSYDDENATLSIALPSLGGTFDFRRATAAEEAGFFPRERAPAPYVYRKPAEANDGWPVATLEEVGLSPEAIGRFVQLLAETPIDSLHAPEIHGVLIARHGKLALEEYFHGFHRDALHDTRSAAKSLASVLTGAAIQHGIAIAPSTPVYQTMVGAAELAGLDARKRTITLEHLLTMSPGLDCDDSDDSSPGNENTMQQQSAQPDWYRYMLDLQAILPPGQKTVYCSGVANLIGGVIGRVGARWLPDAFRDLVAEPLGIRRYALNLTPTGEAYMGGGARFLPRDFMKFGQLMLDGGRWRGQQVVGADWAHRSTSPLAQMRESRYGYLWWVTEYPWRGRTVRAFFAAGNGGQIVMGVPELDLVIAFYGGSYSDPALFVPQRVYVPEHILPAVE